MFKRCLKTLIFLVIFPSLSLAVSLQVEVSGVDKKMAELIRADLHLHNATTEPKLTEARIRNLYDIADEQISTTLQAYGYYNAIIQPTLTQIPGATPEQDKWVANFVIDLGKPTTISLIFLQLDGPGKNDPRIKPLLITPKLIVGRTLNHADYEGTKEKLLSELNSLGYLQADFTESIIEVDRKSSLANIKLTLNTGKQYVFGKITFIDGVYPDFFLERFAPFKPGERYEVKKLIEFQKNLESIDLFSKIRFDPITDLHDPNNLVVPVQVRLSVKPKNRYTGSAGYGTDTGIRGSLGWLHRLQNTPGHKFLANVSASQVRSIGRVSYIIPGSQPATDKYVIGALGQEQHFDELYSRKAEAYLTKGMRRGRFESLYGLSYFTETFHIVTGEKNQNKKYLLPSVKWTWTDAHEKEYFEFGTKVDFQVRAGLKDVLSDASVLQAIMNAKKIFPLTEKMRLLLRTTLGAVASKKNEFDSLPPTLRFFTGGEDTVRGFRYNSLGPRQVQSDQDSVIGGRYLAIGSAEIEHNIYEKLNGVVFFDAGNTALSTKIPLAFAAGVGLRYKTPIGNLRLDLAKPLNTVTNKHWRVHANFGTDF